MAHVTELTANQIQETRAQLLKDGASLAAWAIENGFNPGLVYQVLKGHRKCVRGQSHRIAVRLGLKNELEASLNVAVVLEESRCKKEAALGIEEEKEETAEKF